MKILILKPSSLGDVVQALPVLRLLKQQYPTSEIYWWIDGNLAPLLENDPDLAGVFPFHRKRWGSLWNWGEMFQSILELRSHKFDLVIDLQGLARSGAFAWLANGSLTVGVADTREGASGFYDLAVARPSFGTHAVDWYLAVLNALNVPVHQDFVWLPPRLEARDTVMQKWSAAQSRWIVINPGARWMNKRWPVEYFAELVKEIAEGNSAFKFVILGGKEDQQLGRAIFRAEPERCLDLTGKTTLPEMIEWIRHSELIVTNDTGPMHVAAALKKPVISIFGPTEPRRTGPYGQLNEAIRLPLPCSPCLKSVCTFAKPLECLKGITPTRVHEEIRRRLPRLFETVPEYSQPTSRP